MLALDSPLAVRGAIAAFQGSTVQGVDGLLAEQAQPADCEKVLRFDQGMRNQPGVALA